MEKTEMTAQEVEFLKGIYMDEDRIENGYLYSYQEKALEQYRFAKQYLKEKYPDYQFSVLYGEPTSSLHTYAVFYFQEKYNDCDYELHISQEDNVLVGEDNFYGHIIRTSYDNYIFEHCKFAVDELLAVYSLITGVKGISYDENMTVEEIIDGSKEISPLTEIYLGGPEIPEVEWKNMAALTEKEIRSLGLYGAYTVYYLADINMESVDVKYCHQHLENNDYLYIHSFQNFNR